MLKRKIENFYLARICECIAHTYAMHIAAYTRVLSHLFRSRILERKFPHPESLIKSVKAEWKIRSGVDAINFRFQVLLNKNKLLLLMYLTDYHPSRFHWLNTFLLLAAPLFDNGSQIASCIVNLEKDFFYCSFTTRAQGNAHQSAWPPFN